MPFRGRIYTSTEIAAFLGSNGTGPSKQRISQLAAEHGIRAVSGYDADAWDEYFESRWRMELAREMGWGVNGLVPHDEWDLLEGCPVCGEFAIYQPAPADEVAAYTDGWPWRCRLGHSG